MSDGMDEILERSLHGAASAAERERLAVWRAASPANEQQYQQTLRLVGATRALHAVPAVPEPPSAATIIARTNATARRPSPGRRALRWAPWGVAAAAVLVAALGVLRPARSGGWAPAEVTTSARETSTVKLGDGTVVRLGPGSRLLVSADRPREARLEGRAFFAVTPNPAQPFLVHTRSGTAKVLGTRFHVVTEDEGMRLLVIEGRVALEAPENTVEVHAGEQSGVRFRAATRPTPLDEADTEQAWLGRFLVFQDTPVRTAAHEIERLYGVRVDVADAVADETLTATFTDRPLADVVAVMCAVLNAQCTTHNDTVSIAR